MEISIILPVYNSAKYLKYSIPSILSQTFSNFELLIIDDGSTDNSIEEIKEYNDPRIRIIRNQHNFIQSLNIGISEAQGKYIARMDADDIMVPNRLEIQYQVMQNYKDIVVCSSWCKCFGQINRDYCFFNGYIKNILILLLKNNIITHSTVMIRKDFLIAHHLQYDFYPYAEDYKLWSEIAKKDGKFYIIPQILLNYRTSLDQTSRKKSSEQLQTKLKIQNEILHYLVTYYSQKEKSIKSLFNLIIKFNGYGFISDKTAFDLFFDLFYHIEQN